MRAAVLIAVILAVSNVDVCVAQPEPCASQLERVFAPFPAYPSLEQARTFGLKGTSYAHVFVEGSVLVEFTVSTAGVVTDPKIVESTYRLVGRISASFAPGHFDGFLEMNVFSTLEQWRYKPVERECRGTVTFTYKFDDAV